MNCRSCRALIADLLDGRLDAERAGAVRGHAAACPACRMELALAERIDRGLTGLAAPPPPADFTARVMAALPAPRVAAPPFWPQALSIVACAVSTAAVVYGLVQHLSAWAPLWPAVRALSERATGGPGLPMAAAEPGRAYAYLVWLQAWAADIVASGFAYLRLISGLYSLNAPAVHLLGLGVLLLWVLGDLAHRARA